MAETWTVAQAARLIEKPSHQLMRAVERAPVKPAQAERGSRRVYVLGMRDLVFFCALDDLKQGVTSAKQAELYRALRNLPENVEIGSVEAGSLKFDFRTYARRVKRNIREREKLLQLIDAARDEPVIKGTDISAYRIAALHAGMAVDEIMRDYPTLTERQVIAAKAYAESHPKAGRPYPATTAKATMKGAQADLDGFIPSRT